MLSEVYLQRFGSVWRRPRMYEWRLHHYAREMYVLLSVCICFFLHGHRSLTSIFPSTCRFLLFFSLWILESCTLMLACLPFSFLLFLMQLFKWNIYSFQSSFHFNLSLAEILNSFLRMFLHGFLKCLLS